MTETSAPPACRVCGREIAPNARGDYVACCSPFVAPPAKKSALRTISEPWLRAVEWLLFESHKGVGRYARLVIALFTIGLFLFGLIQIATRL